MAADIPGLGEQEQVASIFLYALPEESTTVTEEHTTVLSTEGRSNRHDRLISTYMYMLTSSVYILYKPLYILHAYFSLVCMDDYDAI